MDAPVVVADEWPYVLSLLPADLAQSAVALAAFRRRREVRSAADLLRLALVYALGDLSLRQTAAWASLAGVAELSDVALLKRLRGASDWLGHLVLQFLSERGLTTDVPALRVRVVDASSLAEPGSQAADWRLHLGLDLGRQQITTVELTDPSGGEQLQRHPAGPGEVLLADRGYAHREGVAGVLAAGGQVVVRLAWRGFPLESQTGHPLDLVAAALVLGVGEVSDRRVWFRWRRQRFEVRLVTCRKTEAAAEHERQRLRKAARSKGRHLSPQTLAAAAFVFVLTSLPPETASATQVLELYRLRWQVEMTFKRLKSLHHLDAVRARDPALATCYLQAKILGALLVDELAREASFSPWGWRLNPP